MKTVFDHLIEQLTTGNPAILATVIHSSGSTPRDAGARMLVRKNQSIAGTIGGGIVEAMVQQAGAELLDKTGNVSLLREFALDNALAAGSGMICGGNVTVLLERIEPEQSTPFQELVTRLQKGESCIVAASYINNDAPGQHMELCSREVFPETAETGYTLQGIEDAATSTFFDTARQTNQPETVTTGKHFAVAEVHHPLPEVILFGAGHVAVPTAELASTVHFAVTVVDDRKEFANKERFPSADSIHVIDSFAELCTQLTVHRNCYVIIVTRGHQHDATVLAQMLETPARYVGMIGSIRKRDNVYEVLQQQGVTPEQIARCHCPIGLDINAQTPEEIAVSIMAEIIQARHA